MAKVDKEQKWRMEGYKSALEFVKKNGVEALEADIRRRGFLGIPVGISKSQIDKFILQITMNLNQTVQTMALMTLNDTFGFGRTRLMRFKEAFDKNTEAIFDFDNLGQHYVTMEDYAVYLNEQFNAGLDVERISACQDACRYEKDNKGKADIAGILTELKSNGFEEAAEFLERKM